MSIFFSMREVIEMAIATERSGQAFYQNASKLARENSLKELFQYLAEEEEKHLKGKTRNNSLQLGGSKTLP